MKVLIVGDRTRYETFLPEAAAKRELELAYAPCGASNEELLALGSDAFALLTDQEHTVNEELIAHMPQLKLIHSEGVAYDCVCTQAAQQRGIYVCNNRGCSADAVADQTLMLMLMLLRRGIPAHRAVRDGSGQQFRGQVLTDGTLTLSDCAVGLIGLGSVAQEVARRLRGFGCQVYYHTPYRRPLEVEMALEVSYLPLEKLLSRCHIISLHCSATPLTRGMVNADFLSRMRPGSYLINTSRGDLVDNEALLTALTEGHLAGFGLDTIDPEPTPADHPLVALPEPLCDRVVCSPHLGGAVTSSFRRAHQNMWANVLRTLDGKRPNNIVNDL